MDPSPLRRHPGTGRLHESPVRPGSGWPGDPAAAALAGSALTDTARADTALTGDALTGDALGGVGAAGDGVARDAAEVAAAAAAAADLDSLDAAVSVCRACPRLVAWREEVAANPRRSFAGEAYWGRPVTGWGPARARIVLLGLAPAAHGGNRTGRIFTGDRSGDWLFAALHRVGLARQASSTAAGDGQSLDLRGGPAVRITAAVHCAPPANVPTPAENAACRPWLLADLRLVPHAVVVVALGGIAWAAALTALGELGCPVPRPRPRFGHGHEVRLVRPGDRPLTVLGCYHPSQQNTFTGVLTAAMTDEVLRRAIELAGPVASPPD